MDKDKIYLVQSDTTVGFSSGDDEKLSGIKKRPKEQKTLQVVDSFYQLKLQTRVPNRFKKLVRNSKHTTFIYPNINSFRVVFANSNHFSFVKKFHSIYSTSANETKKHFSSSYAYDKADIVVYGKDDFFETNGSKIFKLSNKRIKKIR
jgi:tRNA A37 threonylcarbamoyladenosine synthetase subunit TsaC/SUA5/YrdC